MTPIGLTVEQVAARVGMLRRQQRSARVIAIHTSGGWSGGTELRVNGEVLPVVFCASALQVSEALVSIDDASSSLIIITPVDDGELSLDVLARAFTTVTRHVRQRREQQNHEFARSLVDWHRAPTLAEGLLPIEQAMSAIVAKLAAATPVLILIIDGMSYAVFRELCDDFSVQGWTALTAHAGRIMPSLVSTIPSITETSRASLLAGKVVRGQSTLEKQSFAAHADLLTVSRAGHPPLLFHKGELVEAGATGVSPTVRTAIRDTNQRIVAVVLNAVDDHLSRSDQLRLAWTVRQFQHLDALLYEARLANRAVVVTSDHGHVLEDGTRRLSGGEEERWRATSDEPAAEEVVFADTRVEQATGLKRIVVPWSEAVRYGQEKQGYHGGATPQEVLVPIGVFATPDRSIVGWDALPEHKPAWWGQMQTAYVGEPLEPARQTQRAAKPVAPQRSLFSGTEPEGTEASPAAWIDRLLASPVYTAQRRMAGRSAPNNNDVEAFLRTLNQHQNRILRGLLAQALGQPDFRMRRMLLGMQRLLNVDGYQIVAVDEDSGSIELNRQLLDRQFQLS